MADDARISTEFPQHPKVVKLFRRLGHAGPLALIYLWLWVAANRYDGDLSGMTNEDIEIVAGWSGEPDVFVSALIELRLLDGKQGSYSVHDWGEHQPYIVARPSRSKAARQAALTKWSSQTPEQRSAAARHAATAKWKRGTDTVSAKPPAPSRRDGGELELVPVDGGEAESVIRLPLNDGTEYGVSHGEVDEWVTLYPAVNVQQQLRNMRGWLLTNQHKRKTRRGTPAFVNSWLAKEQDKGGSGKRSSAGFGERDYRSSEREAEWAKDYASIEQIPDWAEPATNGDRVRQ